MIDNLELRLLSKVIIPTVEDACWIWTGYCLPDGHGRISVGGVSTGAHVVALELKLGRKLTGQSLHSCDNPPCVNPDHLREGTQADNIADMMSRGRHKSPPAKRGENNRMCKLRDVDIEEILSTHGKSQLELAEKFGVSQTMISAVVTGRRKRSF